MQDYGVGIFDSTYTKSALKKAIKKGLIKVNGERASTATMISGGEKITLQGTESNQAHKSFIYRLKVLFEDEYLAVVHKPAGILVNGNTFKTIANALPSNIKPSPLKDACRPQPVHRLDYATTGVLMVGKTSSSIRTLNRLFEQKSIRKEYFAVTIGQMREMSGEISSMINDKPALSEYKVLKTVTSERFEQLNLVTLNPKTGRRHQLRKHLNELGHPILGDRDYYLEGLLLKGKGMYLHAARLEFIHPFTGKSLIIEDDLPKKFKNIFP
ncbi:RluA family pseudouridine synthase [Roseivirga misakiensis]|uniref:RluA family pseudouridine synthase n=1 Tax=Roseivirga misakiensis TaxID=1563681 RepID=UPI001FDEB831|nr:RluA family pseudouridine synthase [Roseivirga misakiensis]